MTEFADLVVDGRCVRLWAFDSAHRPLVEVGEAEDFTPPFGSGMRLERITAGVMTPVYGISDAHVERCRQRVLALRVHLEVEGEADSG